MTFFTAEDQKHGRELWFAAAPGTTTTLVKDLTPGPVGSPLDRLTPFSGRAAFVNTAADGAPSMWLTDGTDPGTRILSWM
jgi:ELWxxDGT repeat protein